MLKPCYLLGIGGVSLLLLGGCAYDRPASNPSSSNSGGGYSAPAQVASDQANADPDADKSAQIADPLLGGSGGGGQSPDPLLRNDPLLRGDPLKGPVMPTEHSHWLRGQIHDAGLTVIINGVRAGQYAGIVDQDITMKLREGINSVTFVYTPHRASAGAQMDLVESEHHPPIPPLVAFQSEPLPSGTTDFPSTTRQFMFFAK